MELSAEQKTRIAQWAGKGCALSEIQKNLSEEFGLAITFMDLRFLLLDLGIDLKEKPKKPAEPADLSNAPSEEEPDADEFPEPPLPSAADDLGGGSVTVGIDTVTQPGAIVNGTVTFSDGTKARWALDQLGRLAIDAGRPGYRPPPQDLAAFQNQLRHELQKRGF
ncbi:MAG: hypothetical protein JXR37_37400 [Kiritimatiellae bacterium]|nr:hypothetical protein [Kiritimatiellia bacterium]